MIQNKAIRLIEKQDWLDDTADAIKPKILQTFKAGGEPGRKLKNFLHGTWLGHPLHPVLTDIPIGAWTTAAVLDGMEILNRKQYKPQADAAIAIGLLGAAGAAITGLTDWTGTTKKKRKLGLMHGLLNVTATALYATSYALRKQKSSRKSAIGLAFLGYGVAGAAAYLGGHLVYKQQIGVDHTATATPYPQEYTPVLAEKDLKENSMTRVQAGKIPVLMARKNGRIFAIASTCSHLGGPLSEGTLIDGCKVRCPWHQSVFSLKDGRVVDGPATESQPKFHVRVKKGQIEVKLDSSGD